VEPMCEKSEEYVRLTSGPQAQGPAEFVINILSSWSGISVGTPRGNGGPGGRADPTSIYANSQRLILFTEIDLQLS